MFKDRLKLSLEKKTKPWTIADLKSALKVLKKNKARDPNGWANELFKDGVAGKELQLSILHIFNKMKENNEIPELIRKADVCTIYKRKGSKNDLMNDSGVFIVTILRSILMRLIYMDCYNVINEAIKYLSPTID